MGKSQDLYERAKKLIPGGTQLLSKRPEMFLPGLWPAYYDRAKGCEVWDLDGNRYVDMITMGIGACILGYADPDVDAAVMEAVRRGSMTSLNAPEEVELAELLCELHPWADMVRYCRTGGEAMAIAVRIARASTRRDTVMFCGYHGWHDWYLAANLADESALDGHLLPGLDPAGVPRALRGYTVPFAFNDTKAMHAIIGQNKGRIAAIVLESVRNEPPSPEFAAALMETAASNGIALIVDEITAGWRISLGGAHLVSGIRPDIAVFAKAMGNGYPVAAIVGRGAVMQAAQESFISSTYWTERIGPCAALATIGKLRTLGGPDRLIAAGKSVQAGWKECAKAAGLEIHVSGIPPLSHFDFQHKEPLVLKTLFTQLMLERGYLGSTVFYASLAHTAEHIQGYLAAAGECFSAIAGAVLQGGERALLKGEVCHAGFRRLN
jgi:glutamate-1-semialdehyde 2,1-aminomutase